MAIVIGIIVAIMGFMYTFFPHVFIRRGYVISKDKYANPEADRKLAIAVTRFAGILMLLVGPTLLISHFN